MLLLRGKSTYPGCSVFRNHLYAMRSYLYEFGHALPIGIASLRRIEAIIENLDADLPEIVREICRDLRQQIAEKTVRIDAL
jgi:hypothetical protein